MSVLDPLPGIHCANHDHGAQKLKDIYTSLGSFQSCIGALATAIAENRLHASYVISSVSLIPLNRFP